ncbi:MAG: hypothetical protein ACQEQC_05305, partial [Elusimicrobiota bacterium]
VSCVDMESSMIFSAAKEIDRNVLGLFYVTDTVGKMSFYRDFSKKLREKIKGARKSLARKVTDFVINELA